LNQLVGKEGSVVPNTNISPEPSDQDMKMSPKAIVRTPKHKKSKKKSKNKTTEIVMQPLDSEQVPEELDGSPFARDGNGI